MLSSPAARTEDLVQFLLDHGFVPGPRAGTQTDFSHSEGVVITVPTGQEQIPPTFVQALLHQFSMMDLSDADELTQILHG